MSNIGDRVGAVSHADQVTVTLFGFGVYDGDHPIPEGNMLAGVPNPRITLDNGKQVFGFQSWWGPEDKIKEAIGARNVVIAEGYE